MTGLLSVTHLADSPTAVAELSSAIKVGDELGDLLVLERLEVRCLHGNLAPLATRRRRVSSSLCSLHIALSTARCGGALHAILPLLPHDFSSSSSSSQPASGGRLQASGLLRLTRKHSLVAAAASMPRTFEDIKLHLLSPGFVHSVATDAVYVHFLGRVSGRAGLPQLSDVFVSDPSQHFVVGQSVRAQVVQASDSVSLAPCSRTMIDMVTCGTCVAQGWSWTAVTLPAHAVMHSTSQAITVDILAWFVSKYQAHAAQRALGHSHTRFCFLS